MGITNKSSLNISRNEGKAKSEDGLRRELGLMNAMLMVIGMVIGSGIFFRPASVLKNAGAPGLGVLAWVAGGIVTMAAGLTIAEVAAAIPKTGGMFIYLKKLYGEKWAFLLGWVQTLIYIPGSVAGLMVSIFGTLNGYLLSGARIPFAMGQSKLIPFSSFFGKVSKGRGTPANALIFESILAAVYALTGSADKLTDLAVFVLWIFFVMAIIGVFILRKNHKDIERPYKVPLYPFIPIIGIGGGVYILISTLLTNTVNALCGIGITLLGIPVYIYISKKKI